MKCQDANDPGAPNCLIEADERYTMDFSDIGEPPIYWCANCGPRSHLLDQVLTAFMMESPENVEKVKAALDAVQCKSGMCKDSN